MDDLIGFVSLTFFMQHFSIRVCTAFVAHTWKVKFHVVHPWRRTLVFVCNAAVVHDRTRIDVPSLFVCVCVVPSDADKDILVEGYVVFRSYCTALRFCDEVLWTVVFYLLDHVSCC